MIYANEGVFVIQAATANKGTVTVFPVPNRGRVQLKPGERIAVRMTLTQAGDLMLEGDGKVSVHYLTALEGLKQSKQPVAGAEPEGGAK